MHFSRNFSNHFGNDQNGAPSAYAPFWIEKITGLVGYRRLSWATWDVGDFYQIYADGNFIGTTDDLEFFLTHVVRPREHLECWVCGHLNGDEDLGLLHATTPMDEIESRWTGSPGSDYYELYRRTGAAYPTAPIFRNLGRYHKSDPLDDATYTHRAKALDIKGAERDSNESAETISSAPDAPSNIAYTIVGTTLTITWTGSGSADIADYPVRYNGLAIGIPWKTPTLQGSPAASPHTQNIAAFPDGTYHFSVHSRDAAGNEDGNISQMIRFDWNQAINTNTKIMTVSKPMTCSEPATISEPVTGSVTKQMTISKMFSCSEQMTITEPATLPIGELGVPNDPSFETARTAAGGTIRLDFWYFHFDEGAPAVQGRIYSDNGTGTVNFAAPLGVMNMGSPTSPRRFNYTTVPLTHGTTYLFTIRCGSANFPEGSESLNENTVSAVADTSLPGEFTLVTDIV